MRLSNLRCRRASATGSAADVISFAKSASYIGLADSKSAHLMHAFSVLDLLVDVYPEYASTARVSKPVTIERLRDAVLLALKPRTG